MILGRRGEGDKHGGFAEQRQLGDRRGAGPAQDQVGDAVAVLNVRFGPADPGVETGLPVRGKQGVVVVRAGEMQELEASCPIAEKSDGTGHEIIQEPRALAAAEHQQDGFAGAETHVGVQVGSRGRGPGGLHDVLAQRHAGAPAGSGNVGSAPAVAKWP